VIFVYKKASKMPNCSFAKQKINHYYIASRKGKPFQKGGKMKKLLCLVMLSFVFLMKGEALENDTKITFDNMKSYYYEIKGNNMYLSNYTTRFIANGKTAYCIEPGVDIETSTYDSVGWSNTNFSKKDSEYLELLGYFGYDYPTHKTDRYYLATQELIWEYVGKVEARFTTAKNGAGTEINLTNEKKDILKLISEYQKDPNFEKTKFSIKNENEITDLNEVLSNYEITNTDGLDIKNEGNTLKFKNDEASTKEITLKYKKYTNETTLVYVKGSNQKLATLRLSSDKIVKLNFEFVSGKLTVYKKDKQENLLSNAVIGVYDEDNNLIFKGITEQGIFELSDLPYGKYYVKELDAPNGYELNDQKQDFEITEDNLDVSLEIENDLIKNDLIVEVPKTGKNNFLYLSILLLLGMPKLVRKVM
jgi:hypothetical protein